MSPIVSRIGSGFLSGVGFGGRRKLSAATPTYLVSPSTSSVNEGSSVTFTVTTTNVGDGTTLYWTTATVSGTINTSDFNDGITSGSFTITNNSGSISRTLANDATTEGSESFQIEIRTSSTSGTIVATSSTVTIGDTSLTPTYSVSPNTSSVNEGSSVTFTVSTTNISDGTTLYWSTYTNSGTINTSDFNDGSTTGSVTIYSNSGSITRTLANDSSTEGSESFGLYIRTGSTSGTIVATSSAVTIGDTSTSALYSFSSATFTPGGNTGPNGPSLAQAISGLSGTGVDSWKNNTSYFNTSVGIQLWTVPRTGTYTIDAYGAAGGNGSNGYGRGYGARIMGTFTLTQGSKLRILVGQMGASSSLIGGGGGGTFVMKETGTSTSDIYVIAGGGGGGYYSTYNSGTQSGTTSSTGQNGWSGGYSRTGGYGGSSGQGGTVASEGTGGGGGGGLIGNGASGFYGQPSEGSGGYSFSNGGQAYNGETYSGGFGGGGSGDWYSWTGGGGGGGYSGGGGGHYFGNGGGGGSYNNGSSQSNSSGYNSGDGYVTITFVS